MTGRSIFVITTALLILITGELHAQTSDVAKEFWPEVKAVIDVLPKTRVEVYAAKQDGEDLARSQKKIGVAGSYRMKAILQHHLLDIDDEKNYVLVIGAGYERIFTDDNGKDTSENRFYIQGTPKHSVKKLGLLIQDRNRIEFRWVNDSYSTRYRNRLMIERPLRIDWFRFSPYSAGELFYDGQHRTWNQNLYKFGVILPYKKLLSVDAYFLRKNCTTCKEEHVNVFGLTVTLYFDLKKK